ncbi:MAG TPA: DUF1801 domain-containing protein [Acidimicrobiales bacterium]|nr:DUF1801 domain-containing protein [Acidimicrobiales bacterium]
MPAAKKAQTTKKAQAKKAPAKKAAAKKPTAKKSTPMFSAEERAAMRETVRERSAARRKGKTSPADDLAEVLAKIAKMGPSDRALAESVHRIVTSAAPDLAPKTWYGMPAYARDGSIVCYFQDAAKFKSRYAILGFSDKARLDEGEMWPVVYALDKITKADEARIRDLVTKALS